MAQSSGSKIDPFDGLDDRASRALSELPRQEAHIVMALVQAEHCKNISAVTWSKTRKMRDNPMELRLEYFRRNVDDRARKVLDALPEDAIEMVISDVDVLKCRNISALVWSKVKQLGRILPSGEFISREEAQSESNVDNLDEYPEVVLDERCMAALQKLSPEEQAGVLSQVDPQVCNNPSAFVWSKVRALLSMRQ